MDEKKRLRGGWANVGGPTRKRAVTSHPAASLQDEVGQHEFSIEEGTCGMRTSAKVALAQSTRLLQITSHLFNEEVVIKTKTWSLEGLEMLQSFNVDNVDEPVVNV